MFDDVVFNFNRISILVGPNNSGKTSLLRGLSKILSINSNYRQFYESDFRDSVDPIRFYLTFTDLTDDELACFHGHNEPDPQNTDKYMLRMEYKQTEPKLRGELIFSLTQDNVLHYHLQFINTDFIKAIRDPKEFFETRRKAFLGRSLLSFDIQDHEREEIINKLQEAGEIFRGNTDISDFITNLNQNLSGFFTNNETLELEITELDPKRILDNVKLSINQANNENISIYDYGSGYQNIISLALFQTLSNQEELTLLFLEEPEAHLHPQLVRKFMKNLYSTQNTNSNSQFILSTHSPIVVEESSINDVIILHTTQNNSTPKTLPTDFYVQNKKLIKLFRDNLSECLFATKVVLIEGSSDYTIYKTLWGVYQELHNINLNISFFHTKGTGGFKTAIEFFNYFNIPCFLLTDNDKGLKALETLRYTNFFAHPLPQNPVQDYQQILMNESNIAIVTTLEKLLVEKDQNCAQLVLTQIHGTNFTTQYNDAQTHNDETKLMIDLAGKKKPEFSYQFIVELDIYHALQNWPEITDAFSRLRNWY